MLKLKYLFNDMKKLYDIIKESIDEEIYNARNAVNTSPTEKQKDAGNYKKGHVKINGYDITIENPKGSVRKGRDGKGHEWSIVMNNDYGYFRKTKGYDGDAIDVFIGDELESEKIYVVDQKVSGKFDESKVMFCFNSIEDAKKGYMANYDEGWKGFWKITPVNPETFRKWLYDGHKQRKPFAEYVEIIKSNKKDKNMKLNENTLRKLIRESLQKYINEERSKTTTGIHAMADNTATAHEDKEAHDKAVKQEVRRRKAKSDRKARLGTSAEGGVWGDMFESKLYNIVKKNIRECINN